MSTLADLIADSQAYLYASGMEREKETSLTSAITDTTSTTFSIDDGTQVDRGYVEVENELMAVKSSDKTTGQVVLHAWGRGVNGSTAATHALGARVTSNPRFPRSRIVALINECLRGMYPSIYGVATFEQAAQAAKITYPMPAAAVSIISARVKTLGPSQMWMPVTRYQFDPLADTTAFPTGKSLDVYGSLPPGQTLKVVYRADFGQFAGDPTATLASVNCDEAFRDILQLYVCAKMIGSIEGMRLDLGSIQSAAQAQFNQPTQATSVARQLWLQYQSRVVDEKRRLQQQYPSSVVRQG